MSKSLKEFSVAVRRRESPSYDRLYRIAKKIKGFSIPCIGPLHSFLYWEWSIRTSIWHNFWRVVYYEPMLKSQCVSVGHGFRMEYAGNGITRVFGDLQIYMGSNVTIFDNTGFIGLKIFDKPELHIGDNTYVGPFVRFMVGKEIRIGKNCAIGSKLITDNPGHSTNILNRLKDAVGSPAPEDIKPVKIGDFCWLPLDTYVFPGVTLGDGVVALAGTHINKDVPPFCQIAGQPMRIIRKLPIPPEIVELVGKERYESYLKSHEELKL